MNQNYVGLVKYILFFALYLSLAMIGFVALIFVLLSNGVKPPLNPGIAAALVAAICFAVSIQFAHGEKRVSTGKEAAIFAGGAVMAMFVLVFLKLGAYMLYVARFYGAEGERINNLIIERATTFPALGWLMVVFLTVGFNLILLFAVFRTGTDIFSKKYQNS